MTKNKNLSFENEMYNRSVLPDISCGLIILAYSAFILNLSIKEHYLLILGVIVSIFFAQFVFSRITNHFLMGGISRKIIKWKTEGMTLEERTALFKNLHKIPARKQTEALLYFVICSFLLAFAYKLLLDMNIAVNAVNLAACLLGAYLASLLALAYSRSICARYACELVEEGIDQKILKEKQYFGTSYQRTFTFYCTFPILWGVLLSMALFYVYYYNNVPAAAGFLPAASPAELGLKGNQLSRLAVVLAINIVIGIASVYSFLTSI